MIFDSCILIDALNDIAKARHLVRVTSVRMISIITRSEVLAGAHDPLAQQTARNFLDYFQAIIVEVEIADLAGQFRREHRLKLPDALVMASARHLGVGILTRDNGLAAAAGATPAYTLD